MDFGSNKYQVSAYGYSNKVVPPGVFPVFDAEPAQRSFLKSTTSTPLFCSGKNIGDVLVFASPHSLPMAKLTLLQHEHSASQDGL